MNKEILYKKIIDIVENSQDHYSLGIDPHKFIIWHKSLSDYEKDLVTDIIIENLPGYHFVCISSYVKSEKIFQYTLNYIKEAISQNRINEICLTHFSLLLKYPKNVDEKNMILYLMENKSLLKLNNDIKSYPLKILSTKYPEYLEKYLHSIKEIYSFYGNSSIIDVYSGLIELYKENFPEVFLKISKDLTDSELNRVLDNFPVIFSDGKYDDIKEEIYTKLEQYFNRNISREIKT